MKAKTKRPQNAATMSRAALIKETRSRRKEAREAKKKIELLTEANRELRREIERRDQASARFQEIEPAALRLALLVFDQWKAEGSPSLEGIRSETSEKAQAMADRATGGGFWASVYISRVEFYLETIAKCLTEKTEDGEA